MAQHTVDDILFGAAYYSEYIPRDLDRVDDDMAMMKAAGINVIRIAESTWSTEEPQPGVFDFTYVDKSIDAAHKAGIKVIVGTPTYAVPTWMIKMHPEVLADTPNGPGKYGPRQIMDIVNPTFRFYAERIIRTLIAHVADHPAVIGYQVDNETKYYDSVSPTMQTMFIKHLRERFNNDLDALNEAFGLDYWSNRINAWEDFPDVTNSINQSLRGAFDRFRRQTVTDYLAWQASIVREYARDDQFITQNFDYEWRGYSYGIQPAVDHFKAAKAMDIAGVDIYHSTEDELTGHEIGFGGDMTRSIKDGANYLVLETEAQGQHGWLPFPGQLRLQAYSHLANGADSVMYWHWSSIHNSFETYWKGLLSHDYAENPTYREAADFGNTITDPKVGSRLKHLTKHNQVAIMVSNESLSALDWFLIEAGFPFGGTLKYNDVLRAVYDALFDLNIECDFVPVDASLERLNQYKMVVTPALYCTPQSTIDTLQEYVKNGGHLVSTLRSFVTDDDVKVWHDTAPHGLADVFGISYNQFTRPKNVGITFSGTLAGTPDSESSALIELLKPADSTDTLATYTHYAWKDYAAITRNTYGAGSAEWIATMLPPEAMRTVLAEAADHAGITGAGRALAGEITVRQGINAAGETVTYLLNYSAEPADISCPVSGEIVVGGTRIITDGTAVDDITVGPSAGDTVTKDDAITVGPWNVVIIAS